MFICNIHIDMFYYTYIIYTISYIIIYIYIIEYIVYSMLMFCILYIYGIVYNRYTNIYNDVHTALCQVCELAGHRARAYVRNPSTS